MRFTDDGDETESADFYVCAPAETPAFFDDDLFDFCCKCGQKVRFRPGGPVAPKKICLPCALPGIESSAAKGELEMVATTQTAAEVAALLKGGVQ